MKAMTFFVGSVGSDRTYSLRRSLAEKNNSGDRPFFEFFCILPRNSEVSNRFFRLLTKIPASDEEVVEPEPTRRLPSAQVTPEVIVACPVFGSEQ